MAYNTAYTVPFNGFLAQNFNEAGSLSGFIFNSDSASVKTKEQNLLSIITDFVFSYSLRMSMASISSGLSTSVHKKRMKARFNREAYEMGLKKSLEDKDQGVITPLNYQISLEDYSFHIKETSGKVLTCCEVWYK